MSDVFISYARSTEKQAREIAAALRALGYSTWQDQDLPSHRPYADVIEEQLGTAKAVVVVWSAEALRSQWVRSEADRARGERKLVQLNVDGSGPPMPFDQIQCADLSGWSGEHDHPAWLKVVESVAELAGSPAASPSLASDPVTGANRLGSAKPSIAVLPFANLSADPEQEYFADGMVEEIVNALSRVRSIQVIGSGSTLSYKGRAVRAQEIGRQLKVDYVLEGSVRKAAGRVRITVRLDDAGDATQVWADRFEDTLEDVFALQDKVAFHVSAVIQPAIDDAEVRRFSRRPTRNMSSYELMLKARLMIQQADREQALEALGLLEEAIRLDPRFGVAIGLKAYCHGNIVRYGWSDDPAGHRALAQALAQRAVEVAGDDGDVVAWAAAASLLTRADISSCKVLAARALALNPGGTYARRVSGWVHLLAGEIDAAVEHFELAMRLDPFSAWRFLDLGGFGMTRFAQGRFDEAAPLLRECMQLRPTYASSYPVLAACYAHLGELSAARRAMADYAVHSSVPPEEFAAFYFTRPEHRQLLLEGMAKAAEPEPARSSEPGAAATVVGPTTGSVEHPM